MIYFFFNSTQKISKGAEIQVGRFQRGADIEHNPLARNTTLHGIIMYLKLNGYSYQNEPRSVIEQSAIKLGLHNLSNQQDVISKSIIIMNQLFLLTLFISNSHQSSKENVANIRTNVLCSITPLKKIGSYSVLCEQKSAKTLKVG